MASSCLLNGARTGAKHVILTSNKGAAVLPFGRKTITTQVGTLIDEPKKIKYALLKVILVAGSGLFAGAQIAKKGAAILSESNIFNPEVDDDDDDD